MDGFFVAKIQKLSDKRKGEEEKAQAETVHVDDATDDTTKVGSDVDNEKSTGRRMKKGKKREQKSKVDINDNGEENYAHKRSKISVAPTMQVQKSKNKKFNAKMTKPRRMKITGM